VNGGLTRFIKIFTTRPLIRINGPGQSGATKKNKNIFNQEFFFGLLFTLGVLRSNIVVKMGLCYRF
jgi:hypothetical protein